MEGTDTYIYFGLGQCSLYKLNTTRSRSNSQLNCPQQTAENIQTWFK